MAELFAALSPQDWQAIRLTLKLCLYTTVILLLLGFNWIQDMRVRRRMQAELPKIDQDPLLGEPTFSESGRREPGLGGGAVVLPFTGGAQGTPDADSIEPDSATEAVIELTFQGPMAGEDLAPLLMPLRVAAAILCCISTTAPPQTCSPASRT